MVNITGVCLDPNATYHCIFNSVSVPALIINPSRAVCIQPMIFRQNAYVTIELSTEDNKNKRLISKYFLGKMVFETLKQFFPPAWGDNIFNFFRITRKFKRNDIISSRCLQKVLRWSTFSMGSINK